MKKLFSLLLLSLVASLSILAQVTINPVIIQPGYTGPVIVTFDPSKGSGGMVGATECYAHTGLLTSESVGTYDWKYVKGTWRDANQPQLTYVDGKWQLIISNIYTFYGVPEGTEIIALCFVFHDGPNGNKEGKSSKGGDILIYIGEEVIDDIWDNFTPAPVVEQARPDGIVNGIYYGEDGTSVTLCTYAASKTEPAQHVFLLGDMTNWKLNNNYQLKRDGNYFWINLTGLESGREYRFQYAIMRADGVTKQISDLFSEKVIHPDDQYDRNIQDTLSYPKRGADDGYVSVIQTGKTPYNWSAQTLNFQRPDKNNLVIYELWVQDYTAMRTINGLMERLDYLQNLGVNAVELMPVNEFDGNLSWGYNTNHYFALDKAYGTPEQFKLFIDECHKRGIAVILDMAFDHATGLNPMDKLYPYGSGFASNPWFNVTAPHQDQVWDDWNHGFEPVRDHFTRVLQYWLTEYKIDGYRMEMSHGLCSDQANTSVANLIYYYNNGVKAVAEDAYFICEHWGANMATERMQLINEGMLCWENTNGAYCQTAMGWLRDGDAFTQANRDGYVSYCESHDEERMQYKAKTWGKDSIKTNDSIRLARVAENVAFNVLLNGPHMLWQYEEIGYDYSILSDVDQKDAYEDYYRTNIKPRPENLGMFQDANRMAAFTKCAQIIQLRTRLLPSVFEGDPTASLLTSGAKLRYVLWGSDVYVVANFDAAESQTATLPEGTWFDYWNGGSAAPTSVVLKGGEVKIFTGSPLSAPTILDNYNFAIDSAHMVHYQVATQAQNPEMGYTYGDCHVQMNSTVTISAQAKNNYYFVKWSDGNTDNPRQIVVTQDTSFVAIFDMMKTGRCGDDLELTWQYDPTSKSLTISGNGTLNSYYTFGAQAPYEMEKLVVSEGVTSIGQNAFEQCNTLQHISLAASVETIYERAFYNCAGLREIYNYRELPTVVYSNTFDGINKFNCVLHVLSTSVDMYKAATGWRDFYYVQSIDAVEVVEPITDVATEPSDNQVVITWPTSDDAATYTIVITKDGSVVCTLIFNANGQLQGIAFAPGKNASGQASYATKLDNGGMQFTVTGLESGTNYQLTVTTRDASNQEIATYSSDFETTDSSLTTSVETISDHLSPITNKVIRDGVLYILRGNHTYTLTGQRIE